MKSFIVITVLTTICFGVAGFSSRFVEQESVEKAINKTIFKDHKYTKKEKILKIEDATKLDIESFSEDIVFIEDENLKDQVRVNYYEVRDSKSDELIYPKFETVNLNQSLKITFEPAKSNYSMSNISINLKFPYFSITDGSKKRKEMVVSIPKGSNLTHLALESLSGDVSFSNLAFEDVNFEVTSGDLVFENNEIKNLILSSRSGDVSLKSSEFSSLEITSTSGDIDFEKIEIKENFSIKTTAGDVGFTGLLNTGEIKTTAGDISIQTESVQPNLVISATAGDVDLHFLKNPSININTSSLAGDISIDGLEHKKDSNPMRIGSGAGRIQIATTAGDISITTKD